MYIPEVALVLCCLLTLTILPNAQVVSVNPQVRTKTPADAKVTIVEIAAHFVTAIRLPEPVNSVAVGDSTLFQVEHSEREPELVLVKALTEKSVETNLLISGARGRMFSLLLVSHGSAAVPAKVDFLLQYKSSGSFLVEPEVVPFPFVGQTTPIVNADHTTIRGATDDGARQQSFMPTVFATNAAEPTNAERERAAAHSQPKSLDDLLQQQVRAPLPALYGAKLEGDDVKRDRLRVGISEVIDGGQQVIVLFSAVNTSNHPILLMPPQVQLGGKSRKGRIVKHGRWSTSEQLVVADFRLSRRRVETRGRADGVVVFERPPYKQANEQLFLQMAESGAVDRPALAPIGFGVSSFRQEGDYESSGARN